jgi:hypothetical protein
LHHLDVHGAAGQAEPMWSSWQCVNNTRPTASPGTANQERPAEVRVERHWTADGLVGEELSYSVGYGPRTRARLLKPADAAGRLPGVLALHGHDGFK